MSGNNALDNRIIYFRGILLNSIKPNKPERIEATKIPNLALISVGKCVSKDNEVIKRLIVNAIPVKNPTPKIIFQSSPSLNFANPK